MVASPKANKSPYDNEFFQDILRSKEFGMWCNHQDKKSYDDYASLFLNKLNIDVEMLQPLPKELEYQETHKEIKKDEMCFSYQVQEVTVTWQVSDYLRIEILFIHGKAVQHEARFNINKYNSLYVIYDPDEQMITETFIRNIEH